MRRLPLNGPYKSPRSAKKKSLPLKEKTLTIIKKMTEALKLTCNSIFKIARLFDMES